MRSISKYNFEEWIFDALEGNLSREDLKQFHAFFESNPSLKEDYEDWENTYLDEPEMAYPGMDKLLKKEPFIRFGWWKWVFLGAITFFVSYFSIKSIDSFSIPSKEMVHYPLEKFDRPVVKSIKNPKKNLRVKPMRTPIKQDLIIDASRKPAESSLRHKKLKKKKSTEHDNALNKLIIGEVFIKIDSSNAIRQIQPEIVIDAVMVPIDNQKMPGDITVHKVQKSMLNGLSNQHKGLGFEIQDDEIMQAAIIDIPILYEEEIRELEKMEKNYRKVNNLDFRLGLNGGLGFSKLHKEDNESAYLKSLESATSNPVDLSIEVFYKNISFSSGIGYMQRMDSYEILHTGSFFVNNMTWDVTPVLDSSQIDTLYVDTTWTATIDTINTMDLHKYKTRSDFATIPLTLGYRVNIEKLEIVFKAGMMFNILVGSHGKYHTEDNQAIIIGNLEQSPFIRSYIQANVGVDLMYPFSQNFSLSFSPSYLIGLNNIFDPKKSQNAMRVDLIKHKIGLRYSF